MADIHHSIMKNPLFCLVALAAPLLAGELVPSQIPPSTKWMLHVDLDAMRSSETGKAVISRIAADHGAKLLALKRMFSLHLLDDLHDVTLYGDGQPEHAVALISGTFDRAHLEDVIKAADAYETSTHAGTTIHSWKDKKKSQNAAFAADGLLVFSAQDDLLRQALDVLKANVQVPADPFFNADGDKPLISASARLSEIEMPRETARTLKLASVLRLSANENNGRFSIHAAAECADAATANRLRRMLDGVIAFAEAGNPDLSRLDFRHELTPTVDKPGLSATLSLPVPEWLDLMKNAANVKQVRR